MKRLSSLSLLFSVLSFGAEHAVTLTWSDSNPVGTTWRMEKAPGVCSPTSVFTTVKDGITTKTWEDTPIDPGFYCYRVYSKFNGVESVASNTADAKVPTFPPVITGTTVVVK